MKLTIQLIEELIHSTINEMVGGDIAAAVEKRKEAEASLEQMADVEKLVPQAIELIRTKVTKDLQSNDFEGAQKSLRLIQNVSRMPPEKLIELIKFLQNELQL